MQQVGQTSGSVVTATIGLVKGGSFARGGHISTPNTLFLIKVFHSIFFGEQMSGTNEWTPWYRRKEYKGNLTEVEKRYLDSFRLEEKHPAVAIDDLPQEVQGYLSELELAVYDAKQDSVAIKALMLTGMGALVAFFAYQGLGWLPPLVGYVLGGAIITFAWINYYREWKKNADGLWIKQEGKGIPYSTTEEKLQEYWELDAISRFRKRHETEIDEDLG